MLPNCLVLIENSLVLSVCVERSYSIELLCCAGLGGELREIGRIEQRLVEAAKLGFTTFVIPASHMTPSHARLANVRIIRCKHVNDALRAVLGSGQSAATVPAQGSDHGLDDPNDPDEEDDL